MNTDDFTGFLLPGEDPSPFRQAVIVSFNTSTGANTVLLNGGILTDLPLLNIGDTVNLAVGDVVILMKMKSSFAIMGRVIIPGGAALNQNAVTFQSFFDESLGFANSAGFATRITRTVSVPAWANSAAVIAASNAFVGTGTAAGDSIAVRILIDGVSPFASGPGGTDRATSLNISHTVTRAFTVTPGGSFTVVMQTQGTTGGSFANVYGNLNTLILFRKA